METSKNKQIAHKILAILTLCTLVLSTQVNNIYAKDTNSGSINSSNTDSTVSAGGAGGGSAATINSPNTTTSSTQQTDNNPDRNHDGIIDTFEKCAFVENKWEDFCKKNVGNNPNNNGNQNNNNNWYPMPTTFETGKSMPQPQPNQPQMNGPDRNNDWIVDEFEKCAFVENKGEENCKKMMQNKWPDNWNNPNNNGMNNGMNFGLWMEAYKDQVMKLQEELKTAIENWDQAKAQETTKKMMELAQEIKKKMLENQKNQPNNTNTDKANNPQNSKQDKQMEFKKKLSEKVVNMLDKTVDSMPSEKRTVFINKVISKIDSLLEKTENEKKKTLLLTLKDYFKNRLEDTDEEWLVKEILSWN